MGVLNVTPDSFSDGGRWLDPRAAIVRGLEMVAEGADVIDVGGESTRPGAVPVPAQVQIERVVPVIRALAGSARVSVDTRHPAVAEAAISAGATLVNDVSASPEMAKVAASGGAGWVAMHMQGDPQTMQAAPAYGDVVAEVREFLMSRAALGREVGVVEIWVDPGIGFGKTLDHNLALLRAVGELGGPDLPVLVGTSRKAFLGKLTATGEEMPPPEDRVEASVATAVWSVVQGAAMVRVHDVKETVEALRLVGEPVMAEVA
jgi:dihydropteroate synthase